MVPGAETLAPVIDYPSSDGKPMANDTEQLRWMVILFGNLCALFDKVADVFVAVDLLWYPVEFQPKICAAPDVMVAFGRPKGRRGSYKHWEEEGVPVTVAFEIISHSNTLREMIDKFHFYEDYGVEEYYVYNPLTNRLHVYLRKGEQLLRRRFSRDFVSPRLGIRFDLTGSELVVYYPDGRRFLTFEELEAARALLEKQLGVAEQRATKAEERNRRLIALARAVRLGQATPEQIAELEQLERDLS